MVNDRKSLTKGTTEQLYHYDTLNLKDVHTFQNTQTKTMVRSCLADWALIIL